MYSKLMLCCLMATVAFFAHAAPSKDTNILANCITNPCVTVPGVGRLVGTKKSSDVSGKNIYSYYGIPYGQPTGGENRFAPPKPAAPVNDGSGKYDATYSSYLFSWMGKMCPQAGLSLKESYVSLMSQAKYMDEEEQRAMNASMKSMEGKSVAGSEDCLHLAVYTPRKPSDLESGNKPLLPVMFFIHGGAFYMGTYFGMGPKSLLEHDVVLVEIQYRLGPLGYLCLDHPEAAGNMGMLDQTLALDWVREHVAGFGGDPEQITVFGESAGAASATYHMVSPKSQDKFARVIGESGSALAGWAFDNQPEKHAKEIAARLGCPTDTLDAMVQCLKWEKSIKEIVDEHGAYIKDERSHGRMGFGGTSPCAQTAGDEVFIDKHPEKYIRDGDFKPKPLVMGANKHEGSFVLGVMYNSYIHPHGLTHNSSFLKHDFIPIMLDALGLDDSSGVIYEILEHDYFNYTDLGDWDAMMPGMINLVGTFFIKAATYEFMKYNSIHGGDSYFYSLEYEGPNSVWNLLFTTGSSPPLPHGCTHGDDLIYLFSTGLFKRSEEDEAISQELATLWTNFATHGKMTLAESPMKGVPMVTPWSEAKPIYLKVDHNDEILTDYIATWANPDRNPNGNNNYGRK